MCSRGHDERYMMTVEGLEGEPRGFCVVCQIKGLEGDPDLIEANRAQSILADINEAFQKQMEV